ncbi:type II toxin-antitoxin system RelB/DinJ family antitoxin, partial [Lachnoanaerobaculum saburreum]
QVQNMASTNMASTLIQFRTEDTEKIKSIQILDKLGLTLPAYLKMCMSRLNQEQGIPFSMKLNEADTPGIRALEKASKIAKEYNILDMSPDEINAEIADVRK